MTSSIPSTPNSKRNFKSTPKKSIKRVIAPCETPECFTNVNVETPVARKRISKEKSDELSNLTVAVRIRPMNIRELTSSSVYDVITVKNKEIIVTPPSTGHGAGTDHIFQYDHVFWSVNSEKLDYASQEDVYLSIGSPLIEKAFRGYNACLLAYGQTGSGKSYSMMGEISEKSDTAGIIPRFCHDLFKKISELPQSCTAIVKLSYFEIYNEKIHDLLSLSGVTPENRIVLKVREHPMWGPYVENLSQHVAKSYNELKDWLEIGNKRRATAATVMNEKSSRSHSIFSVELSLDSEGDNGRQSKISLVDLAGSERLGSVNVSDVRHRQGVCINRSLLTLGKVISALADQKKSQFVPYRESILTWLLRESLGGNSLTSMLATITPASTHTEETLATLRYACQARSIQNRAHVNEDPHNRLIRELRAEIDRLRTLRHNYEQNCLTISTNLDDSNTHELEDLRQRLSQTENHLEDAEKRKEQLESQVRVMCTLEHSIVLSPYKSNFLEELENVLGSDENSPYANDDAETFIRTVKDCFENNGLEISLLYCTLTDKVTIKNNAANTTAICDFSHLKAKFNFDNPECFLNALKWTAGKISRKSFTKDLILKHFNRLQSNVNELKPLVIQDENLSKAFEDINKALQGFDKAMKVRSRSPFKSVTFNL